MQPNPGRSEESPKYHSLCSLPRLAPPIQTDELLNLRLAGTRHFVGKMRRLFPRAPPDKMSWHGNRRFFPVSAHDLPKTRYHQGLACVHSAQMSGTIQKTYQLSKFLCKYSSLFSNTFLALG